MLDRTIPPPFQTIDFVPVQWPTIYPLQPERPLFVLDTGQQPLIKLELVFDAGTWYEPFPGVAYLTTKMLLEGTKHRSAQAIAGAIDQYGADLAIKVEPDICSIVLITLSRHLEPMLALLTELLLEPSFDAQRLAHLQNLTAQSLKVREERNSYLAHKKFKEALFTPEHPYGRSLDTQTLQTVSSAHLQQYHQNQLLSGGCVLLSGQVREQDIKVVEQYLRLIPVYPTQPLSALASLPSPNQVELPAPQSLQAAISVGKTFVTKDHTDFSSLLVLNTLLGGYFGSRLMRNLREDKGYTYGIFSQIVSLRHISYLHITTEVMREAASAACEEIKKEVQILQDTFTSESELQQLRQYMLGAWLASTNDSFAAMEQFKEAYLHGLGETYFTQLYDTIQEISADEIQRLANTYLVPEDLSQVIVN